MKQISIIPVVTSVAARNALQKLVRVNYFHRRPHDRGDDKWILQHFRAHVVLNASETHWFSRYGPGENVTEFKDPVIQVPPDACELFNSVRWWVSFKDGSEQKLLPYSQVVSLGRAGKIAHVYPECGAERWFSAQEMGF